MATGPAALILDKLGFGPLSKTGAEMLLEIFSQRYERTSHHVHILEMNGDSFRLKNSRAKKDSATQ